MTKLLKSCCFCFALKNGCFTVAVYLLVHGVALLILTSAYLTNDFIDGVGDKITNSILILYGITGILWIVAGFLIIRDTKRRDSSSLKSWAGVMVIIGVISTVYVVFHLIKEGIEASSIAIYALEAPLIVYFAIVLWSYGEECSEVLDLDVDVLEDQAYEMEEQKVPRSSYVVEKKQVKNVDE